MPIEPTMFATIGFLFASLIAMAIIPLVHDRAVRLTTNRLKSVVPQQTKETRAYKSLLHAEVAKSTRNFESIIEQLKSKITDQGVELKKKGDAINRLKIERDALNIKIAALEIQAAAAALSIQTEERARLAQDRKLLSQDTEGRVIEDTWPQDECENQAKQQDSFARDEYTRHTSIVPAMGQSAMPDTWTRNDRDSEPIVQLDSANSQLARALSLNVPDPTKTSE